MILVHLYRPLPSTSSVSAEEHNAAGGYNLRYNAVPLGHAEIQGPGSLLKWVKNSLAETCGVEW